jgi:hypothetical protein
MPIIDDNGLKAIAGFRIFFFSLYFSFFTRFCAFNYISFGISQPQGNEFMIKNALDSAFENDF